MPDQPVGSGADDRLSSSALILALDTTHEFGSIALARGDTILEEVPLHEPTGFAHVIYEHLARLLARHALTAADIDCFAAASGPGSFTGVRIGLACIKGLAEALGKPAVTVSNLQAMACFGTAPLRAVLIDARRGEVYAAVYDSAGKVVTPEVVTRLDVWLKTLPEGELDVIAAAAFDLPLKTVTAPAALASAVARIALHRFRRGEASDPAGLDANYVRRSDAELFWKE